MSLLMLLPAHVWALASLGSFIFCLSWGLVSPNRSFIPCTVFLWPFFAWRVWLDNVLLIMGQEFFSSLSFARFTPCICSPWVAHYIALLGGQVVLKCHIRVIWTTYMPNDKWLDDCDKYLTMDRHHWDREYNTNLGREHLCCYEWVALCMSVSFLDPTS